MNNKLVVSIQKYNPKMGCVVYERDEISQVIITKESSGGNEVIDEYVLHIHTKCDRSFVHRFDSSSEAESMLEDIIDFILGNRNARIDIE